MASRSFRALQIIALSAFIAGTAHAGSQNTATFGGGGGQSFRLACGESGDRGVLVGVHGRKGMWIGQVMAICVELTTGGKWRGQPYKKGPAGGSGVANCRQKLCHKDEVVAAIHGRYGSYVHQIDLQCVPVGNETGSRVVTVAGSAPAGGVGDWKTCPGKKPARGFVGKSGLYIDSIGLTCHTGQTPWVYDTQKNSWKKSG